MNPLVKRVADDGVGHVGKPRSRELRQVSLLWEVVVDLRKVGPDVEEVLGGKSLVVGQFNYPAGGLFNN